MKYGNFDPDPVNEKTLWIHKEVLGKKSCRLLICNFYFLLMCFVKNLLSLLAPTFLNLYFKIQTRGLRVSKRNFAFELDTKAANKKTFTK